MVFWNSSKGLGKHKLILNPMLFIEWSNAVICYLIFIWGEKESKRKLDMALSKQKWWILPAKKKWTENILRGKEGFVTNVLNFLST